MSKRSLRVMAWTAGIVSFLTPWGVFLNHPRPATATPSAEQPRQVIIKKIIRKVYTQAPATTQPQPKVRYVYVSGGGGGTAVSSGGGGGSSAPAATSGSKP
jgi:hypothetical protein